MAIEIAPTDGAPLPSDGTHLRARFNGYNAAFPQAPWSGYKSSGIGRELSRAGLEAFAALNWFGV